MGHNARLELTSIISHRKHLCTICIYFMLHFMVHFEDKNSNIIKTLYNIIRKMYLSKYLPKLKRAAPDIGCQVRESRDPMGNIVSRRSKLNLCVRNSKLVGSWCRGECEFLEYPLLERLVVNWCDTSLVTSISPSLALNFIMSLYGMRREMEAKGTLSRVDWRDISFEDA